MPAYSPVLFQRTGLVAFRSLSFSASQRTMQAIPPGSLRSRTSYSLPISLFCFSRGKIPSHPLSWFLAAVSRLRPLLLKLYVLFTSLIPHTASAVPRSFPTISAILQSISALKSVADTFGLPHGGSATCGISRRWHRKLSVGLLAQYPGLFSCHANQATHELRFYTCMPSVATGNAWRRRRRK